MADRSDVNITVLNQHVKRVEDLYRPSRVVEEDTVSILYYEDMKNGDLGIEHILQKELIPYDKEWASGCEYASGTEKFRVLPDGTTKLVIKFSDDGDISIGDLSSIIESNSDDSEKVNKIKEMIAKCQEKDIPGLR